MNSEISILKLLISNKHQLFTIRKIAELTKINYRIVHEKISSLEREELIKTTKIGNTRICQLTQNFNEKIFIAEYQRRDEIMKKKDLKIFKQRLSELKFPMIALLFGSQVKGKSTKDSDIDLLVVSENEKGIEETISLWPEKIHLTHMSYNDFIHMNKSKEFSVVSEVIKNNVILLGIEEYYRLLQNAY